MTQVSSTNKSRFFTAAMGHNFRFNVKDNMKLMIVIFVLHFAAAPLLLITMLTQLAASHSPDIDGGFIAAAVIGTGLAAAAGMICALSVFKYLYKKSAVDMRLSLPMTTGQRFVSDFLSGLFIYVVPFIGAELISLLLTLIGHLAFDGKLITEKTVLENGEINYYSWKCHVFEELYPFIWRTILGGLMLMVMFYVITVIAAGCCGNIFESAAYDILLCGLVPLAVVLAVSTVSQNIKGFSENTYLIKLVPWCGPFGGAYGLVIALESLRYDLNYEYGYNDYGLGFGKWFIIFTLITAALGFAAYLIYRKRKAEDTGKPVVFGIFYHIIMTVGIFSLCYLMIMNGTQNFVPVFVISFIIYFVMHVIRNRGFGKIVKGLVIYAVTVLLSVGSFLLLNDTKCFGAGDFVPAADKVTKAETRYTGQLENTYITSKKYEIRDPEALRILTQVHRDIIDSYNSDSDIGFNCYMEDGLLIKYTLSSGRTVTRYYSSVDSKAMNELSNHDHSRFLTRTNRIVGRLYKPEDAEKAEKGINYGTFRSGAVIQMTWPGAPTIYYGDEAGVCGWTDPDNRRTFPWGKEDLELTEFHRYLTGIRNRTPVFRRGAFKPLLAENGMIAYGRFDADEQGVVVVNSEDYAQRVRIPVWEAEVTAAAMDRVMLTDAKRYTVGRLKYPVVDGVMEVELPGNGAMIFIVRSSVQDDEKTA